MWNGPSGVSFRHEFQKGERKATLYRYILYLAGPPLVGVVSVLIPDLEAYIHSLLLVSARVSVLSILHVFTVVQ